MSGWVLQYLLKHILWRPRSKDRHSNHPIPSFNHEIHATHFHKLCANCFISCKVEQLRQDLCPKAAYTSHFRQIKRLLRGRTNKYICQEAGAKASVWHHEYIILLLCLLTTSSALVPSTPAQRTAAVLLSIAFHVHHCLDTLQRRGPWKGRAKCAL